MKWRWDGSSGRILLGDNIGGGAVTLRPNSVQRAEVCITTGFTFHCIYVYMCIYVCMYVRMYVCMYVCIYVCTYVFMYVCTYILAVGIMVRACSMEFNGKGQGGSGESLEKRKWNQASCFYPKDGGSTFLNTVVPIHQVHGIGITHHQIITLRLWSVFIHPHRWYCNSLIISMSWKLTVFYTHYVLGVDCNPVYSTLWTPGLYNNHWTIYLSVQSKTVG